MRAKTYNVLRWLLIIVIGHDYLTESSKSPAESAKQLFGVELRSEADCEYPLDLWILVADMEYGY